MHSGWPLVTIIIAVIVAVVIIIAIILLMRRKRNPTKQVETQSDKFDTNSIYDEIAENIPNVHTPQRKSNIAEATKSIEMQMCDNNDRYTHKGKADQQRSTHAGNTNQKGSEIGGEKELENIYLKPMNSVYLQMGTRSENEYVNSDMSKKVVGAGKVNEGFQNLAVPRENPKITFEVFC